MRRAADSFTTADDNWDEDEEDVWGADERPQRLGRCHLAEFFDTDDAEGDRMDTDRLKPHDFEEPPDACGGCGGSGSSGAPNAFVASLTGRQSR